MFIYTVRDDNLWSYGDLLMIKIDGLSVQLLIARLLFSSIFLIGGFWKISHHDMLLASMVIHHVPIATVLSYCAAYMELFCSLGLLLGFKTKYSAYFIFFYMIIITWYYHITAILQVDILSTAFNFFIKNVAIMGGALNLAAIGGGKYSLDYVIKNGECLSDVKRVGAAY